MELIIDTNIIFSALIKDGKTRELILMDDIDISVPEFFYVELKNNRYEIMKKTGLDEGEFSSLINILFEDIDVVPKKEFEGNISEAKDIIEDIDPDDVPFIALALEKDSPIWSDDGHFQEQKEIEVFKTHELLEKLSLL